MDPLLVSAPRENLKWTSPSEPREAGIVSIGRDPFTAGLYSQGGEPCVLGEIAGCLGFRAQVLENRPVAISRCCNRRIRLLEKRSTEVEDVVSRAGMGVDPSVCSDPDHARQDLGRDAVGGRSVHDRLKPFFV